MIPYLQVENLTRYWGETPLFTDLSFTIAKEQKVALIARNGAGKTTLMNIIMGLDKPDSGKITFFGDITVGYLSQNPDLVPEYTITEEVYNSTSPLLQAVREYEMALSGSPEFNLEKCIEAMDHLNAWDYEAKIKQILSQLKITNFDQKIEELSGGQKKRVALAKVLINEPDLLMMDEPTNHLDLDMIEWLENYLQKTKCTLFMVTHDRYFLDRVCNEILEVDNFGLYRYRGNYTYFLEKRQERKEIQQSEVEKAQNILRTELEWMRRMPKARSHKAKYRVEAFHALKEKASKNYSEEELALDMKSSRLGTKVINIFNIFKGYGDLKLINDFSYKFARFEKVGIVGANGTGKSTLLNLLTGALKPDSGRVEIGETVKFGYYTQDGITFNPDDKVIDVVKEIAEVIDFGNGQKMTATQLLNYFLFQGDMQYTRVEKLSGGEKRRLYLCTVLMQNPNFLILDEPTNDLDIMTLNVLEEYLQKFNGCVLIVSHDRYFMDKIVDHLFVFEGNCTIKDFPGNYSIYRDMLDEKEREEKSVDVQTEKKPQREKSSESKVRKLSFNEKREMAQLEEEIAKIESEKSDLEAILESGTASHELLTEKSNRYAELKDLLDEKEMRWLELNEIEST